jgi:hypothetical protein
MCLCGPSLCHSPLPLGWWVGTVSRHHSTASSLLFSLFFSSLCSSSHPLSTTTVCALMDVYLSALLCSLTLPLLFTQSCHMPTSLALHLSPSCVSLCPLFLLSPLSGCACIGFPNTYRLCVVSCTWTFTVRLSQRVAPEIFLLSITTLYVSLPCCRPSLAPLRAAGMCLSLTCVGDGGLQGPKRVDDEMMEWMQPDEFGPLLSSELSSLLNYNPYVHL